MLISDLLDRGLKGYVEPFLQSLRQNLNDFLWKRLNFLVSVVGGWKDPEHGDTFRQCKLLLFLSVNSELEISEIKVQNIEI